jgi:hypothetical protein
MNTVLPIIVSAADQTESTFTVNGGVFQKKWSDNTVAELQVLARYFNLAPSLRTKAELVRALQLKISWQSEEEAFRRWPILTQLEVPEFAINNLYNKIYRETMEDMELNVPEFLAFGQRALDFLKKRGEDFKNAERRAEQERNSPPAWHDQLLGSLIEKAGFEAPKTPHVLVKVRLDEMDHDGYCSGVDDEDEAFVSKEYIFFGALPAGDYDFSKKTWLGGVSCTSGCGCCGVRDRYTLLSVQQVA